MMTISQMIEANNRDVRRRRRSAAIDKFLMRTLMASTLWALAAVMITMLTSSGPL